MVYSLQFIIVGEQEQFVVYGLQLTVYHSWRTRTVYGLWFMVYGLQFIIVGEQERFMIMSMDQPRTSLLNNFVL